MAPRRNAAFSVAALQPPRLTAAGTTERGPTVDGLRSDCTAINECSGVTGVDGGNNAGALIEVVNPKVRVAQPTLNAVEHRGRRPVEPLVDDTS